jgi:3-methyladenine DNA glycosylase AlkD
MKQADFLVRQIRRELEQGGSPAYAKRMQMFFKSPVKAYGWRTEEVRTLALRLREEILAQPDGGLLFAVAEQLFAGPTLEEANLGVALLERSLKQFGEKEFRRLEKWLSNIRDWSGCDALCIDLLGPMVQADPRLLRRVLPWAKSRNYWKRRAAAVTLVPSARRGLYTKEVFRLADRLLRDREYMVQKGVGWLLKDASKARGRRGKVVSYLLRVRKRAPRLVLRTACEKLPERERRRILAVS